MRVLEEIDMIVKNAQAMLNASNPKSRTSYPVSQQTGVASSPGQKFDFRGEAIKLLKSYGANSSRANGRYSTDIGRNMISQWKDMKANPQKYDEARQRQILEQWKSNIAQIRAGSSQHANPRSIASAPQKQQPVSQATKNPRVGTTVRRTWSGRPVGAGQPQFATDALAKVENAKNNKLMTPNAEFSPAEQKIIDQYDRLFGLSGRSKALRVIDLKRKSNALRSSSPGVTTRNPDGSITTRWSGHRQGGVTRQQAEMDPVAAQKWNMAQRVRDMMNLLQ